MDIDNVKTIIDAAREAVAPKTIGEGTHQKIVYTTLKGAQTIDLSGLNTAPFRKTGTTWVLDAASLTQLLAANAIPGATTVYVDPNADKPAIVAVFNGHGAAGPGFGDHRGAITFRPTPQWLKWKGIDGKMLPQADFAEFVEDNLADIADPSAAEMMELVTYLNATRSGEFRSAVRLGNGTVSFTNVENVEARVGSSEKAVPEAFTIALAPIFGVIPIKVPARFRYRIQDRKLLMGFKLHRVEDVMAMVVKDIVAAVALPEGTMMVYGVAP